MTGIKFRRNTKENLKNVLPAEIVYAIDTNEWGLGLPNSTVVWRTHEILFPNLYLQGEGTPEDFRGEIGMYYFDLENLIVYQKQQSGWEEISYPISQTIIDATYLPKGDVPTYADFSTVIKKDGSIKVENGYVPVDPQDVVTVKAVVGKMGVLKNDGSTQMYAGYVPEGQGIIINNGLEGVGFKLPTTKPLEGGVLWNKNGVPTLTVKMDYLKKLYGRNDQDLIWGQLFGYNVKINNGIIAIADPDYWQAEYYGEIALYDTVGNLIRRIWVEYDSEDRMNDLGQYDLAMNDTHIGAGHNYGDDQYFLWNIDGTFIKKIERPPSFNGTGFAGGGGAMSSTNVFVGGYGSSADQAVYIFDMSGDYVDKIFNPDGGQYFGTSIFVNATYIMIKSYSAVHVYDVTTFAFIRTILCPGVNGQFGFSMSQRGDYFYVADYAFVNIGAPQYNKGKVYIFDLSGGLIKELSGDLTQQQSNFGYSISVDDNYLVVGDPDHRVEDHQTGQGAFFLYTNTGTYIKTVPPMDSVIDDDDTDYFGWSVAIEEGTIIVGAWNDSEGDPDDVANTAYAGSAYIYDASTL